MEGTMSTTRSVIIGNVCDGVGAVDVNEGLHDLLGSVGEVDRDDDAGIGHPGTALIDELDPLQCETPLVMMLLTLVGESSVGWGIFFFVSSWSEAGRKGDAFISRELPASVDSGRILGETIIFELPALFGCPEEIKFVGENDVKDGEAWDDK